MPEQLRCANNAVRRNGSETLSPQNYGKFHPFLLKLCLKADVHAITDRYMRWPAHSPSASMVFKVDENTDLVNVQRKIDGVALKHLSCIEVRWLRRLARGHFLTPPITMWCLTQEVNQEKCQGQRSRGDGIHNSLAVCISLGFGWGIIKVRHYCNFTGWGGL